MKQLKVFEDLTMFEQQILCHKIPKTFDVLPIKTEDGFNSNQQNKIMQEFKRRKLNVELEQYELKIQQYEQLYQKDLIELRSQLLTTNTVTNIHQLDTLMRHITLYLNHYTNKFIHEIRFRESQFHIKLIRHRHRHRHRNTSTKQKLIDVYPQTIVDVPNISLNSNQLDYLSRNGQYK